MMLIVKSIFRYVQLCCGQYMTILDLVTYLGGGQRVIILITFATMNHIQKFWKVKFDSLTIELICLWNIVGDIVGCIMVYRRNEKRSLELQVGKIQEQLNRMPNIILGKHLSNKKR